MSALNVDTLLVRGAASALVFFAASGACLGADSRDADIAELKRAIEELRAQNRALASRQIGRASCRERV